MTVPQIAVKVRKYFEHKWPVMLKGGAKKDDRDECIRAFRTYGASVCFVSLGLGLLLFPAAIRSEEQTAAPVHLNIEALAPGETLTYESPGRISSRRGPRRRR